MCKSCQQIRINGLVCHETGCPDEWRDEIRDCKECGCEFTPQSRWQAYCSPCCAAAATGTECNCDGCREFREEVAMET